ncbi:CBL-interacting serine/threonine-protein kinase 14 [Acorus calamus]|uniref:non-specific serine/threonine protein kinase n=1 Tax=Acorus calamus TaxID=4465 RepID=A0AAV9EJC1_ACOCL|nr:CBL-interacting serine/threonine-protein kinase 14 [Acorus calamus]
MMSEISGDRPSEKILFDRYAVGRLLGRGAFAKVYHARDTLTGSSVAVKCIAKHRILKSGLSGNVEREISVMRRLRHPNIVRLHSVLASKSKIYFVVDLAKGGELFSRISKSGRLTEDLARRYFQQLISAVGYCHSRGVFHRDLKPENLLLDESGDLKVTDFGLSAVSDQIRTDGLLHTLCGTPAYVAPEILTKKGYDGAKIDVWSCGVILFVLVAGYLPFNDPNLMVMYKKIYNGDYKCPRWASPEAKNLISRLLDSNPETRITIDGVIEDPWFKKGLKGPVRFFHDHEADMPKRVELGDRFMNAFDIISFSTGFDLSGLIEPGVTDRERFTAVGAAEGVMVKVEGYFGVRRRGKGLGVCVVEGQNGNFVGRVWVYRLTEGVSVVEVEKGVGWGEVIGGGLREAVEGGGEGEVVGV